MSVTPTKSIHWAGDSQGYEYTVSPSPAMPQTPRFRTLSLDPQTPPLNTSPLDPSIVHDVLLFGKVDYKFDVSIDPAKMLSTSLSSSSLTPDVLKEDATSPSSKCVRITNRYLPWEIEVTPSDVSSSACVTVSDVLSGLYRALRFSVTDEEYKQAGSSSVEKAFKKRCDRLVERSVRDAENERKKGIKRVDFLCSKHIFCGFTVEDGKLRMHVK